MSDPHSFSPLTLRGLTLRNRLAVSPMCQYSSEDGFANDWHLIHLVSRAVGGAGLVMMEATAVDPRGRISAADQGIWKDDHIAFLTRIAACLRAYGATPGIQLAHAGRKASTALPWNGGRRVSENQGGWLPVAPSPVPFQKDDPPSEEMSIPAIHNLVGAFVAAAQRALAAGFQVVEIHGAHGYLLHQFLSPLCNFRTDEYGGSFENRIRLLLEVTEAVRAVWPDDLPLFVRVSATDWAEGGWDLYQSVELARRLRGLGVDLIDCSSGGAVPHQRIEVKPGYQVPFAGRIRRDAGVATGAVGMITTALQADTIIREGQADLVLLARAFLRDPYFPLHAAKELGVEMLPPMQYLRAF